MSGAPTSCSRRSSVVEHGMAYGARALRSRSTIVLVGVTPHQGARESRAQEEVAQVAGESGAVEVREMRNAEAAQTLVRGYSEKATGELIDTETVTISSEGGRWKRAEEYLAGGLPYLMHGSEAEAGEVIPSRYHHRTSGTHLCAGASYRVCAALHYLRKLRHQIAHPTGIARGHAMPHRLKPSRRLPVYSLGLNCPPPRPKLHRGRSLWAMTL